MNQKNMIDKSSMKAVYLLSLGCSKNLVDAECMSTIITEDQHLIVNNPEQADVIIVNTCGFIESAKKEAIDSILSMADYKKPVGKADFLIVTGCLSQRYAGDILKDLPEVDALLGTADYDKIADLIRQLYADKNPETFLPQTAGSIKHLSVGRKPSSGKKYAYIKVAEGCSNNCNYCAIPGIRGPFISREMGEIIEEAERLSKQGYDELILIAQDTTRYGLDIYGRRTLPELLESLCRIEAVRLIRIMYVYSDGITPELISVMSKNDKIANYLDLPIQHASDKILKSMNRHDNQEQIRKIISDLRVSMPDIVLRSTVMVGFPGETADDFNIMMNFLDEIKFDRLGCFVYSPEEGTPAYDFKPKVRSDVSARRLDKVMNLQQKISVEKNLQRIGSIIYVTLESVHDNGIFYIGRSYAEAPEVDPVILVAAEHEGLAIGQTCKVKVLDADEYDLTGVTVE